jgi:hypothetical protein
MLLFNVIFVAVKRIGLKITLLSVNSWVESPQDDETRVGEALVRLQATMLARVVSRYEYSGS